MNLTKKLKIFIFSCGIILLTCFIGYFFLFSSPSPGAKMERFVIPLKTSESEIIKALHSQGFIKSPTAFKFILNFRGWQNKIKPGGYKISKGMSAFKIAEILVNHPYQKWVILYEGLRKEEMAEIIGKQLNWGKAQKNEFLKTGKEGYLFPDTYLFNLNYSGADIAKRMMSHFNEEVADLLKEAQKNNIRNDTLIILASLIQREAANEKEMPLISGIIWNRWLADMYLEIDASLQYVLGKPGNWWPVVKKEDYKIDSPYNTYVKKGRPPTPICNPGRAAIKAVIFPKESNYFYYLHDQNRKIHLARTYKEHLENINQYIIFPAIRNFTEEYLKTYKKTKGENYQALKSFLTDNQLDYLAQHPFAFKNNFVTFDSFEILEIKEKENDKTKNKKERMYLAKIKFYYKGKILKNPKSEKEIVKIYIIKKNKEFKTPNWNLFEKIEI